MLFYRGASAGGGVADGGFAAEAGIPMASGLGKTCVAMKSRCAARTLSVRSIHIWMVWS